MFDLIVIGGGPSGIMAALQASGENIRVLLIEKNNQIGKKLLLTGGKRCNVTNLKTNDNFIKEIPINQKFLYSSLYQFGPRDIYDYFKELGVILKIEDNDRVFPQDNKASTIVDALVEVLDKSNVTINYNETVKEVVVLDSLKKVTTNERSYEASNVVIATGGCSYPQTGSTGDGYLFADKLKHQVNPLYPVGTFLITKECFPLAGITLDEVLIKFNQKEVTGSLLFTHNGLSGPVVFKISEEVAKELVSNKEVKIELDLIPAYSLKQLLDKLSKYYPKKELISFVRDYLPKRLGDYLLEDKLSNVKIGTISKEKKLFILEKFKNFTINITATGSLEQSFVTGGGVDLKQINPQTMESTINQGVYFVGETLDIHGHTGGYNITLALSTGFTAGKAIKEKYEGK